MRSLTLSAGGNFLDCALYGLATVRRPGQGNDAVLATYSRALPSELRARLIPEEALEPGRIAGDEEAVARLLPEEPSGLAAERRPTSPERRSRATAS